jgi:hypothetical protein
VDIKSKTSQVAYSDKPLLTSFLHELTIARKQLALYPVDHPNIKTSINKTLDILTELFHSDQIITLGITPDALLFQQIWLDKEDSSNRDFAEFFSSLGIASISFHFGLKESELIRFNQLLRAKRETIEEFGGFEEMLKQQQIEHISIVPINYSAFQASHDSKIQQEQIWETFLHGLQSGVLDFGDTESQLDLAAIADILNRNDNNGNQEQYGKSIEKFIETRIQQEDFARTYTETDRKLNSLLGQLQPQAQEQLFNRIFQVLDRHQSAAPGLLKKIHVELLHGALARKAQQQNMSSRLFDLANNLAGAEGSIHRRTVQGIGDDLSPDVVRARLDVLFSEERQDLYMPDAYQTALGDALCQDITGSIPEEEKQKLKGQLEEQSVEHNFVSILIEMLQNQLSKEQENAIQQNLIDLSRFFLDTGDFVNLIDIYDFWSRYLYSGNSIVNIFDEKVLANQTQSSFMAEVLDSFECWESDIHPKIANYIATVGEPYSDLVIEQLGLAPTWEKRKHWMDILVLIGGDAQTKIMKALDDERWYLVRNLLSVLDKQLAPKSIKRVQQLCSHPHPKVRMESTRILFSCNPATANRLLLTELQTTEFDSRLAAIEIAGISQDQRVLELLHKILAKDPGNEQQLQTQLETVRTLTRIGNRESLPILNRVIRKQRFVATRRIKILQEEIIRNLALFPGDSAAKLLQEHCSGKFKQLAKQLLGQKK